MFGGHIREQICHFKNLRILDLSYNNLSGQIPSCIIDMGSTHYDGNFLGETNGYILRELKFSDANFLLHNTFNLMQIKELMNYGLELMSKERLYFLEKNIINRVCNRFIFE